jgi:hypothetical protein
MGGDTLGSMAIELALKQAMLMIVDKLFQDVWRLGCEII